MFKKFIISLLLGSLVFNFTGCKITEHKQVTLSNSFFAFDTTCNISIQNYDDEETAKGYLKKMQLLAETYDKTLSRTVEGSDIYEINHRTSLDVMVTDMTMTLFEVAKGMYDWSNHRFDISVGNLIELWDVKNRKELPTKGEIDAALKTCNAMNYVIEKDVDPEYIKSHRIVFENLSSKYDLGALVKGYITDMMVGQMEEYGINAAIINLGGNVYCYGTKNNNAPFLVGIERPFENSKVLTSEYVINKAVVTSGIYQRYFKVDGSDRIYSHIIDNITGEPIDNNLYSVSIISQNTLLGDYLSTACLLIGVENSKILIDFAKRTFGDDEIKAIFVDNNYNIERY